MPRTQKVILAVVGGVFALALLGMWRIGVRAEQSADQSWLGSGQPNEMMPNPVATPDASWAANRCRPMVACCGPNTAGRRTRRTYPATLAESDESFVRGDLGAAVEIG